MILKETSLGTELSDVDEFELYETFYCGQCFRWEQILDNVFSGVALGQHIVIEKSKNGFLFKGVKLSEFKNKWFNYFDLDTNYTFIKDELSKIHPILSEATAYSKGIRILRQDYWETLCSFIISQNNNIPRIKGIISRMCESFGDKINDTFFAFPKPDTLAHLSKKDLEVLRAGFRADYILDAAYKVASREVDFEKINKLSLCEAEKNLMKIKGVGTKIAQCTLLYGFHRLEAFPMDVWMKKAMKVLFPGKDVSFFGKYAGIAQQYIYHYSRMHKELFINV